ncbi:hypothetical protein LCGC14_2921090 [marine sediment metagenome]|uniref:Uncharacterized protein n=1 Tax=marine sediment metagenome TaxID=412755 RepID=A0A0F8YAK2_9ZZZZ
MALARFQLDLGIPQKVYNKIPEARRTAFLAEVKALKALSVRINEGKGNEEMTVKATFHICHHDEPGNTISCNDTLVEI